jgi:hypothetical protein
VGIDKVVARALVLHRSEAEAWPGGLEAFEGEHGPEGGRAAQRLPAAAARALLDRLLAWRPAPPRACGAPAAVRT